MNEDFEILRGKALVCILILICKSTRIFVYLSKNQKRMLKISKILMKQKELSISKSTDKYYTTCRKFFDNVKEFFIQIFISIL